MQSLAPVLHPLRWTSFRDQPCKDEKMSKWK
jgi:hypothetical protein